MKINNAVIAFIAMISLFTGCATAPISTTNEKPQEQGAEAKKGINEISPIVAVDPNESVRDLSKDKILLLAGMGVRQTNWKYAISQDNTHSNYQIEDALYTSYEGNLSVTKLGAVVGFNIATEDQVISNVKQVSGYLGIKRLLFRSEGGAFRGSVDYRGFSTGNVTKTFEFDQEYRYGEVVYLFKDTPFFAGIRHTRWKLPLEIVALKNGEDSGQTVFDEDFKFNYTSLSVGMDYMTHIMQNPKFFHSGWGLMGKVTGNYGWGKATLGQTAIEDSEQIYGGGKRFTENEFDMLTAEMEVSLGAMYAKAWEYVRMAAGIGYNYNLFTISSMAEQSSSDSEMTPVAIVFFHNHGPIFRLQVLF